MVYTFSGWCKPQKVLISWEWFWIGNWLEHASSSFTYESVEECNIHLNKIDLRRGATYIENPKWLKNKKAKVNPINTKDVDCFMYAATIALYHDKLGSNPERISEKLSIYTQVFN